MPVIEQKFSVGMIELLHLSDVADPYPARLSDDPGILLYGHRKQLRSIHLIPVLLRHYDSRSVTRIVVADVNCHRKASRLGLHVGRGVQIKLICSMLSSGPGSRQVRQG